MLFANMAWRNIWRNKRRSSLGVILISFSMMALVVFTSIIGGFQEQMIESSVTTYAGYIHINRKGFFENENLQAFIEKPEAIIKELEEIPHVKALTTRTLAGGLLSQGNISVGCMIVGIDPERETKVTRFNKGIIAGQGRFLQSSDDKKIIMGIDMTKRMNVSLHDEITLLVPSVTGSLEAMIVEIVGIFDSGNPEFNKNMVMMNQSSCAELVLYKNRTSQIVASIDYDKNLPKTLAVIKEKMKNFKTFYGDFTKPGKQLVEELEEFDGAPSLESDEHESSFEAIQEYDDVYAESEKGIEFERNFEVLSWRDILRGLVDITKLQNAMMRIILMVIFFAVFIIVLNVMIMTVMERKKEFGIMKSLGVKSKQLAKMIFMESLMMTSLAIIIGASVGIFICLFLYFNPVPIKVDVALLQTGLLKPMVKPILSVRSLLRPAVALLITALLAPLWPMKKISQLTPAETVRAL